MNHQPQKLPHSNASETPTFFISDEGIPILPLPPDDSAPTTKLTAATAEEVAGGGGRREESGGWEWWWDSVSIAAVGAIDDFNVLRILEIKFVSEDFPSLSLYIINKKKEKKGRKDGTMGNETGKSEILWAKFKDKVL